MGRPAVPAPAKTRILQLLHQDHLSQTEIAAKIGVSRSTVARIRASES